MFSAGFVDCVAPEVEFQLLPFAFSCQSNINGFDIRSGAAQSGGKSPEPGGPVGTAHGRDGEKKPGIKGEGCNLGRVDEIRRIRCLDNSKQKKGRERREAGNKRLFSGRWAGTSADQFVEGTGVEGEVEGLSGLSRNTWLHLTPPPVFLLELPLSATSCPPEPPAPPHSGTEAGNPTKRPTEPFRTPSEPSELMWEAAKFEHT